MCLRKILLYAFVVATAVTLVENTDNANNFLVGRKQVSYRTEQLSEDKFLDVSRLSDTTHLREAVRNILVPRVVGTEGHKRVRHYIANSLKELNWDVELHKFHADTPIFGELQFQNIIATLNPKAERFLTLACHYDSKYFPDGEFLGATDSAVPCAMLLNLAKVLHAQLQTYRDSKLSLMFIFFDGEEAFKEWGPHDSIYGARHLARKWETESLLDRLDIMMLLDLLGAPDPKFYSFFSNTESWYTRLMDIEDRLSGAGLMERYQSSGVVQRNSNRYFQPNALRSSSLIEDDHIPFLRRNVPILHLIPTPFPNVWHTVHDNESVIDYATTENLARIIRLFTMEYLSGNAATTTDAQD